jgi:hypothetical protein
MHGGTNQEAIPYLVMELIEGRRLMATVTLMS